MIIRSPSLTLPWRSANAWLSPSRPPFVHWQKTHPSFSTMRKQSVEYGYIERVEHLSDYQPGGYHPVRIDDRLSARYRIVHKLGHGTYSTAWLAVDEKAQRYVCVKVGTADSDRSESNVLSQLTLNLQNRNDPPFIAAMLDRFDVCEPNGEHQCIVTRPARCSLRDAREASWNGLFELDVARCLAAQLVLALSLVHSQGYAHGDLHLGNLFLRLPSSLDGISVQQLYSRYGEPDRVPVVRLDTSEPSTDPGVPAYAVPAMRLGKPSHEITLPEANIILGDFGVAFRPAEGSRFVSFTPLVLRPPEAFFEPKTPLTFASDIWSLGCVIFELLAHRSLIDGFLAPQDEITAQQVDLQGPMPREWWERWEKRSKWYDEAGTPLSNASDVWSWERRVEQWMQTPRRRNGMGIIGAEEQVELLKLLKWMLAWRPSDRPDVGTVLKTEWMTQWALPAYQKGLELASLTTEQPE